MQYLLYSLFALFYFQATPGILKPAHWSHRIEKVNDTQYKLIYEVKLDHDWGTYSPISDLSEGQKNQVISKKYMIVYLRQR